MTAGVFVCSKALLEVIMIETIITAIFAAGLLASVCLGISVIYPLIFGYFLFAGYALKKGHKLKTLAKDTLNGIMTVKNILITFVLIGMLTAVWRACGTIAFIVYYAAGLCSPSVMALASFVLCALLSMLTGTSFGTAATMGVICATMAESMGVPAVLYGGAILAGSFFGDRCSPMSTSALLVCELTKTDIYINIKNMVKSAAVPAVLSCIIYAAAGSYFGSGGGAASDVTGIFARCFNLNVLTLLPAAAIIVLSLMKVNVKIAMSVSIAAGAAVCVFIQDMSAAELVRSALCGYAPENAELAELMSGGGIVSMIRVAAIVCISSSYAGIFDGTGFLDGIRSGIAEAGRRTSAFAATVLTSVVTAMVSCNQTLAVMLTYQLCSDSEKDNERFALFLEDSVVLTAALIPWSIACAVPLAAVGAPSAAAAAAVYLYLQPLWGLFIHRNKRV